MAGTVYRVLAICFATATVNSKEIATVYANSLNFRTIGDNTLQTVDARSAIDCARQCKSQDTCATFYFNPLTQQCSMSENIDSHRGRYGRYIDCPEDKGYLMYVRKKVALCLKHNPTRIRNVSVALDGCEKDGGRLMLIENEEAYLLVADILDSLGETRGIWLDGSDVHENDTFYTSLGERVPFLRWGDGDPDGGPQDCLRLTRDDDDIFKFYDIWCNNYNKATEYSTLCQIVGEDG